MLLRTQPSDLTKATSSAYPIQNVWIDLQFMRTTVPAELSVPNRPRRRCHHVTNGRTVMLSSSASSYVTTPGLKRSTTNDRVCVSAIGLS